MSNALGVSPVHKNIKMRFYLNEIDKIWTSELSTSTHEGSLMFSEYLLALIMSQFLDSDSPALHHSSIVSR